MIIFFKKWLEFRSIYFTYLSFLPSYKHNIYFVYQNNPSILLCHYPCTYFCNQQWNLHHIDNISKQHWLEIQQYVYMKYIPKQPNNIFCILTCSFYCCMAHVSLFTSITAFLLAITFNFKLKPLKDYQNNSNCCLILKVSRSKNYFIYFTSHIRCHIVRQVWPTCSNWI